MPVTIDNAASRNRATQISLQRRYVARVMHDLTKGRAVAPQRIKTAIRFSTNCAIYDMGELGGTLTTRERKEMEARAKRDICNV